MNFDDDSDDDDLESALDRRTVLHQREALSRLASRIERPRPHLLVVAGSHTVGKLAAIADGMTIGRALGVGLLLREDGVSRRHAQMCFTTEGTIRVLDLKSSNGTFVNSVRIDGDAEVDEGDHLQVGNAVMLLVYLGEQAPEDLATPLSIRDELTGAYTRRHFTRELDAEVEAARGTGLPLSVVLVGIDRLHRIADRHGISVRDKIVQTVGRLVGDTIQDKDVVLARYAEDEFALLLPDTPAHDAHQYAAWIRRAADTLSATFSDVLPRPAFSVGVACVDDPQARAEDVLEAAERSLATDRARSANAATVLSAM